MPSRPPVHRSAGWRPREVVINEVRREADVRRKDDPARALYRTTRWRNLRLEKLRANPLCQCDECGAGLKRVTPATVVDHRKSHRGDEGLFFDWDNLRSMSKPCHDRKTATEDGGFGNRRRG